MKATLCDICQSRIGTDSGGHLSWYDNVRRAKQELDLCQNHYQQITSGIIDMASKAKRVAAGMME